MMAVVAWALVWALVAVGVGLFIGRMARWADIEVEVAGWIIPDTLPEEWVSG